MAISPFRLRVRRSRLLFAPLAAVSLFAGQAQAELEWWKGPAGGNALERRDITVSPSTASRTKWDEGYIEARAGATADLKAAISRAQARSMALKAARHLAYEKLAETVEGLSLTGETTLRAESLHSSTLRTQVEAKIQGARVLNETVTDLPDGSVWAEVIISLPIHGHGSLSSSLGGWAPAAPPSSYRPNPAYSTEERYTGVIVDASGLGFSPALAPRLLAEDDQTEIYGPQRVALPALETHGVVGYTANILNAKADSRGGFNPLIIRALGVAGNRKGDLLISRRDAERILAADRHSDVLKRAALIIVVGKGPGDLLREGQRHALVIGINEYPASLGSQPIPPLRFAATDAQDLADLLIHKGGYPRENVDTLLNGAATREGIHTALRSLRGKVREEDTVLIFFSGHGTTGPGRDGIPHYYLVPSDGRVEDLYGTAIRDDALEELVGQLPSKKVLVLLDACYSGGIGEKRTKGFSNPLVQVVPRSGIFLEAGEGRVILSASRPDQVSIEDDQVRHGVFTHFLLEALGGKADYDHNGEVTVLEAYQYLSGEVPGYTVRTHGIEQRPVLEVRGMSGQLALAATR